jgi:hypothetical protein
MKQRPWLSSLAAVLIFVAAPALAQSPTGNLAGRVTSPDGQTVPGVTVTVTSPTLQGARPTTTSENGTYLIPLLPPGTYTVTFELENFQTVQRMLAVAATQNAVLDIEMAPAAVSVAVDVVGKAQPFIQTAQVATSFHQDLMAALASNRTVDAVLLMAPAVHPTGPRGAFTINGSQSYENLYTLNGAVINENLRGAPMTPYIEDAIQEVTVASAGISAEYGRFAGGVANAVTKSGGNQFTGSFRTSFANDSWRSYTPFESTQLTVNPAAQLKLDKTVPTYEATFGGPLRHDRLWFFSALRSQKQESQRTTVGTTIPYTRTNDEQRYEGKLTYTPGVGHSLQGSYFKLNQVLGNFTGSNVADLASLTNQGQPQSMVAAQYTGVLTPNFSLSVQYSARKFALTDVGADATDPIMGTMVLDSQRGWRFWSPTFCSGSACFGDEERNNENAAVKGSYFLSNASGAHHLAFGYDYFNDNIIANTQPTGSGYRLRATSSIVRGTDIFPVLAPNSTLLDYNPILKLSQGSNLRMHSTFINDNWRMDDRLTVNVGLRLDKNAATDGDGTNVGDGLSISPRLSTTWDPSGEGKWALSGSFARYTMALTSNLAGATAKAGNPATYRWVYTGPAINMGVTDATPTSSLVKTEDALRSLFAWHESLGGAARPPAAVSLPGVNMTIQNKLDSPYSIEYAGGVSRTVGSRGTVRTDFVFRDYRNFYSLRTDRSTGQVSDGVGNTYDLNVIENTDRTERRYVGLTTQGSYDFRRVSVGGNYTLSHAYGDLEGETVNGGPSGAQVDSYPEYRVAAWNYPSGDLNIDQRHRARMWGTYNVPINSAAGALTIGLMQQVSSGLPYAAVGTLNPGSFMANPGYLTPPTQLEYYFLGRNPFRTETTYRTDLSVNYGYRISGHATAPELFVHGELLNLFNQFQLCGCGENVFRNGGIADLTTIGQGVRIIAPFNPYTTQPVEGTQWERLANLGQPQNAFAYTTPRVFRFAVGVRF